MSAPVKRKITLELPKVKDLSKNRLSVFQRLGTKKRIPQIVPAPVETNKEEPKRIITVAEISAPSAAIIPKSVEPVDNIKQHNSWDQSTLEDADPDILEKKREELQQELKLQLEMDASKKKEAMKKIKKVVRSSSSSDSSSSSGSDSSSDDSSSSSSTTSRESRRKAKKRNVRQRRDSSSSSDHGKKPAKKHVKKAVDASKRLAIKKAVHLTNKIRVKKVVGSPALIRKPVRSVSPLPKVAVKYQIKAKMLATKKEKINIIEVRERAREKEREFQLREKEREREKEKLRFRERGRSRSPRSNIRSRSPRRISPTVARVREIKKKTPERRAPSPARYRSSNSARRDRSDDRSVDRTSVRRHETIKERERRERQEREAARNKEREEALARCQERQRERERIAKEKLRRLERDRENDGGLEKPDRHRPVERLLPRPAERARALAAARSPGGKSLDRDRSRSPGSPRSRQIRDRDRSFDRNERGYVEHHDRRSRSRDREFIPVRPRRDESPYERPPVRDTRDYREADRTYDDRVPRPERRAPHDYTARVDYPDDPPPRRDHERDWDRDANIPREPERGRYERTEHNREWDREIPSTSHGHNIEPEPYQAPSREWNDHQWKETEAWPAAEKERGDWKYKERGAWNDPHHEEHIPPTTGGPPPHAGHVPHQPRRWQPDWHAKSKEDPHMEYMPRHPKLPPKEMMGERPMYRRHHPGHPSMYHHNQGPRKPHMQMQPNRFQNPNKYSINRTQQNQMNLHLNQIIPNRVLTPPTLLVRASIEPQPDPIKIEPLASPTIAAIPSTPTDKDKEELVTPSTPTPAAIEDETKIIEDPKSPTSEHPPGALTDPVGEEEDNLSEISDDPDDILTREEENVEQPAEQTEINEDPPSDQIGNGENLKQEHPSDAPPGLDANETEEFSDTKIAGKLHANKELKEEMDLDFEEISDGELEEEAKFKGLGDALGVDWASLVEESRRSSLKPDQTVPVSAKKRWQAHRILLDIGISVNMAGEEFAKRVLTDSKMKLKEEMDELRQLKVKKEEEIFDGIKIKKEILDEDEMEVKDPVEVKKEEKEKEDDDFHDIDKISHPVAAVQVALRDKQELRRNLIMKATGPYSRALCARRDLQIRRQLCGFPIKESNDRPETAGVSEELREMAIKLFQSTLHNKIKVQ